MTPKRRSVVNSLRSVTDRPPLRRRLLIASLVAGLVVAGAGVAAAAWWPGPVSADVRGLPGGVLGAADLAGLELRVTPSAGARAQDVTVRLDGEPLELTPDGDDLTVRPADLTDGRHDLVVEVAGRRAVRHRRHVAAPVHRRHDPSRPHPARPARRRQPARGAHGDRGRRGRGRGQGQRHAGRCQRQPVRGDASLPARDGGRRGDGRGREHRGPDRGRPRDPPGHARGPHDGAGVDGGLAARADPEDGERGPHRHRPARHQGRGRARRLRHRGAAGAPDRRGEGLLRRTEGDQGPPCHGRPGRRAASWPSATRGWAGGPGGTGTATG